MALVVPHLQSCDSHLIRLVGVTVEERRIHVDGDNFHLFLESVLILLQPLLGRDICQERIQSISSEPSLVPRPPRPHSEGVLFLFWGGGGGESPFESYPPPPPIP